MGWRFPIYYFFKCCSEWIEIYFRVSPFSSPSNSFSMLFIHSAFLICSLRSYILLRNSFASLSLVVGISSCILPLLAGRIFFRCFGLSCFVCIVLSCLDIFLAPLLSPVPSDLFCRIVLLVVLLNDIAGKLFVLDGNIWYHSTEFKLFILRIITWSYNYLIRIISIAYLKSCNCVQI